MVTRQRHAARQLSFHFCCGNVGRAKDVAIGSIRKVNFDLVRHCLWAALRMITRGRAGGVAFAFDTRNSRCRRRRAEKRNEGSIRATCGRHVAEVGHKPCRTHERFPSAGAFKSKATQDNCTAQVGGGGKRRRREEEEEGGGGGGGGGGLRREAACGDAVFNSSSFEPNRL